MNQSNRKRKCMGWIAYLLVCVIMLGSFQGITAQAEESVPETQTYEMETIPSETETELVVEQTETPETETPETEAPETEAPETEAPETEAPETEAPETEAPETEVPETEAQETEAQETETETETEKNTAEIVMMYLGQPATEDISQAIIFQVDTDGKSLEYAVLSYIDPVSGQNTQAASVEIADDYIAFLISGTALEQSNLQTLSVTVGGEAIECSISDFISSQETVSGSFQEEGTISDESQIEAYSTQETGLVAGDASQIGSILAAAGAEADAGEDVSRAASTLVVVLDPGHGGYDGGASRTWNGVSYIEKDIALKISQATKEELETYAGVRVYMTRTSDVYVGLKERVDYAVSVGADVLVSQHINSTAQNQTTVSGALVYVSTGKYRPDVANEAKELAAEILSKLSSIGLENMGFLIQESDDGDKYPNGQPSDYMAIIRYGILANLPSMIVEHGFVSNPSDCELYYGSDEKIKALGVADARAIAEYYGLQKKNTGTIQPGFNVVNGKTRYYTEDLKMVTGWYRIDGDLYYFNRYGTMLTGRWKLTDGYYHHFHDDGVVKSGWNTINGKKYFMNSRGVMQFGWLKYGTKWYYLQSDGSLAISKHLKVDGNYYYVNRYGRRVTGWGKLGTSVLYYDSNGIRQHGWTDIDGETYYFRTVNGHMVKSYWTTRNGSWVYLKSDGTMAKSETLYIGGSWYQFAANGACLNR